MATDVAYFTYMYAKVDKQHYQKVTSHTHAATFAGKFIGGTMSQILVYFKWMDYRQLNYLTLATQTMATVWALFLPNVKTSQYFHRPTTNQSLVMHEGDNEEDNRRLASNKLAHNGTYNLNGDGEKNKAVGPFKLLWLHFKSAYSNKQVLQWSIWYALAMCGYYQVVSYIQVLWLAIDSTQEVSCLKCKRFLEVLV
jgi:solute carrier family 19 (thiamine transporter), member 2/3